MASDFFNDEELSILFAQPDRLSEAVGSEGTAHLKTQPGGIEGVLSSAHIGLRQDIDPVAFNENYESMAKKYGYSGDRVTDFASIQAQRADQTRRTSTAKMAHGAAPNQTAAQEFLDDIAYATEDIPILGGVVRMHNYVQDFMTSVISGLGEGSIDIATGLPAQGLLNATNKTPNIMKLFPVPGQDTKGVATSEERAQAIRGEVEFLEAAVGFKESIRGKFGVNEEFAQTFFGQAAGAVGQAIPVTAAFFANPAAGALVANSQQFSSTFQFYMNNVDNPDPVRAAKFASSVSVVTAPMEFMGVERLFGTLFNRASTPVKGEILRALIQSPIVEAVEEFAQGVVTDFFSKEFDVIDDFDIIGPERYREMGIGAVSALFLSGGSAAALLAKGSAPDGSKLSTEEFFASSAFKEDIIKAAEADPNISIEGVEVITAAFNGDKKAQGLFDSILGASLAESQGAEVKESVKEVSKLVGEVKAATSEIEANLDVVEDQGDVPLRPADPRDPVPADVLQEQRREAAIIEEQNALQADLQEINDLMEISAEPDTAFVPEKELTTTQEKTVSAILGHMSGISEFGALTGRQGPKLTQKRFEVLKKEVRGDKRVAKAIERGLEKLNNANAKAQLQKETTAFKEQEKTSNLKEKQEQAQNDLRLANKLASNKLRERFAKTFKKAREKIRDNKRNASLFLDEIKQNVNEVQALVNENNKLLPASDRIKTPSLADITSKKGSVATPDGLISLEKALNRTLNKVESLYAKAELRVLNRTLNKLLDKNDPRKGALGRLSKKLDVQTLSEVVKVADAMRLSVPEVEAKVFEFQSQESLTEDELDSLSFLSKFGGILGPDRGLFNALSLSQAIEEVENIIGGGQATSKAQRAERAADVKNQREQANAAVLGDQVALDQEDIDLLGKKRWKSIKVGLNSFQTRMQSLEWLMDHVTNDKSKQLKGYLQRYHRDTVEAGSKAWRGTTDIHESMESFLEGLFNQKSKGKIAKAIKEMDTPTTDTNIWVNGSKKTMSQNQAISWWMASKDESLIPTFEKHGWDAEVMEQVESFIGEDGVKIGNHLLEFYSDYFVGVNEVYEQTEGHSLRQVFNYSPISREGDPSEADSGFMAFNSPQSTAKNGSLITRQKSTNRLVFRSAFNVFGSHVSKMEHYKAHARLSQDMKAVLLHPDFKLAVKQMAGAPTLQTLERFVDDIVNGGVNNQLKYNTLDKIRSGITKASLALKPTLFLKQLTSIPAYVSSVPTLEYAKLSAEFWLDPVKNTQTLFESDYIQERWTEGHERDVRDAMRGFAGPTFKRTTSLTDRMMFMTRLGDISAVVMGGYPVYKYNYNQLRKTKGHAEAHKEALFELDLATKRSQQSARLEDLAQWQRGNSWSKLFTMYMTAPASYYRMEEAAIRNAIKGRLSVGEMLKTVAIYHFVLPNLFQLASDAFLLFSDDDERMEEIIRRHKRASIVGSFNGILVLGEILETVMDKWTGKDDVRWEQSLPISSFLTELAEGIGNTPESLRDFMESEMGVDAVKSLAEDSLVTPILTGFGFPIETVGNYYEAVEDAITESTEFPIMRFLGYGDNALMEDTKSSGVDPYKKIEAQMMRDLLGN